MDTEALYRAQSAELQPDRRVSVRPDGTPAPTGYFPDRSWPQQGRVSFSPVFDDRYGGARVEQVGGELVDQHPWFQVTATIVAPPPEGRLDGRDDPMTDGPSAPTPRLLGLFYARAQGTDQTHYLNAPGVTFPPIGSQDGASWSYFQDARIAMMPYAPGPNSNGQMPDSLRAIPPSPPHGWAEQPAMNARQVELDKLTQLGQQKGPHQDRLANSTYAGQSYSATTQHVGGQGTGGTGQTRSWRGRG